MSILKRASILFYLALFELAYASPAFAADQATPQPYPWPWWREMHWSGFGWIFPLVCFVMMLVMFLFMLRRGGMACMWRDRSADKSGLHDSMKRPSRGQSGSALEILNERYARGEIGKEEYQEKKAAISSSS